MTSMVAAAGGCVVMASLLLRREDGPFRERKAVEMPPSELGMADETPVHSALSQIIRENPGCTAETQNPITRAEWQADAPAVTVAGGGEHGPYHATLNPNGWLVYDQPMSEVLNTIVIHHSALPLSDGPREIQQLHMEERGFADVGYHFMIDENGLLYAGRALNVRGAHTYGQNYGTVGICLIGNFEEIQPAPEQISILISLISCLTGLYPGITRLAGHKDYNAGTLCPGANLAPLLPAIAETHGLLYGA